MRPTLPILVLLAAAPSFAAAQQPSSGAAETLTPGTLAAMGIALPTGPSQKRVLRDSDGEVSTLGESSETLSRLRGDDGQEVYLRIQDRRMGGRSAADTVVFRVRDLAPVSRVSHGLDGRRTEVRFRGNEVEWTAGTAEGPETKKLAHEGAFFDANVLDHLCAALAMQGSGTYRVPLFSDGAGAVVDYVVTVGSAEAVEMPGGPRPAIHVEYTDPTGRTASVWVDPETGHVLREEAVIGPGTRIVMLRDEVAEGQPSR